MAIIMLTAWYPMLKRMEAAKIAIEVAKKFPPDETIGKNLATGFMRDKHGVKVVIMSEVMEGKLTEALERVNDTVALYDDIEGFNIKTDLMTTPLEAWATINMKPPE